MFHFLIGWQFCLVARTGPLRQDLGGMEFGLVSTDTASFPESVVKSLLPGTLAQIDDDRWIDSIKPIPLLMSWQPIDAETYARLRDENDIAKLTLINGLIQRIEPNGKEASSGSS